MARHNQIGAWGEQLARDWLLARGFAIYEQNAHAGGVEIDIILIIGTPDTSHTL